MTVEGSVVSESLVKWQATHPHLKPTWLEGGTADPNGEGATGSVSESSPPVSGSPIRRTDVRAIGHCDPSARFGLCIQPHRRNPSLAEGINKAYSRGPPIICAHASRCPNQGPWPASNVFRRAPGIKSMPLRTSFGVPRKSSSPPNEQWRMLNRPYFFLAEVGS